MLYKAGYAETMIAKSRRHLATSELERAARYFRNTIFDTSRKANISIRSEMGETLTDPRLTVELLHKSAPFGLQGETV